MDSSALLKLASSAAHEAIADLQRAIVNYTAKGDAFTSEKPRLWTDQSIAEVGTARNYDLHPDGKLICCVNASRDTGSTEGAEPCNLPRKLL